MKKLLTVLIIFMTFSLSANDETKNYRMITDIMSYLRIDQWIDYVKRIKTDDEIPNYYNYPPVTKATKFYFNKFDILGYETGLHEQIVKHISDSDLEECHKVLKNPFVSKILNLLFFKSINNLRFSRLVLLAKDEEVKEQRLPLIKSIYNLLMFSPMAEHMLKTIHSNEIQAENINKVLHKDNEHFSGNIKAKLARTKWESVQKVFYLKIDQALRVISANELRQFINMIKGKGTQKFLGLYNTYDYFFMYNYSKMLHDKEGKNIKRGLKSKK